MLQEAALDRILDAQRRSYRLLLWMKDAVDKGRVTLDAAEHAGA